jgi:tetratricopeptide (TPR) repeat protein
MSVILRISLFAIVLAATGCRRSADHYLQKGNSLFEAGDFRNASLNYRKAVQIDSRSGEACYRLGLAEMKLENPQSAFHAFSRAAGLLPERMDVRDAMSEILLTAYLVDKRRSKEVRKRLWDTSEQMLTKDPQSYGALRVRGFLALDEGKRDEAIQLLERANRVKPNQRNLVPVLARLLFLTGRAAEGERLALQLIEADRKFDSGYNVLYQYYAESGRAADAVTVLRRKIESDPSNADYVIELAEHLRRSGAADQASATLELLTRNPGKYTQTHLKLGDYYFAGEKFDAAVEEYKKGEAAEPELSTLYGTRRATALEAAGRRSEAAQLFWDVFQRDGKALDSLARWTRIEIQGADAQKLSAVEAKLKELTARRPNKSDLGLMLSEVYAAKGDLARTQTELENVLRERNSSIQARLALAQVGRHKRDYASMLIHADTVLAAMPGNSQARLLRAVGLMGAGRHTEAATELDELIRVEPGNMDAQVERALLFLVEQRFTEAAAAFRSVRQAGDVRGTEGLSEVFLAQSQPEKALEVWHAELRQSPDSPVVQMGLAQTLMRAQRFGEATRLLERVVAVQPNSADVYLKLGQAYALAGQSEPALRALEKARSLSPSLISDAAAYLGFLLQSSGRREEAEKTYRSVLSSRPGDASTQNNLAFLLATSGRNMDEALSLAKAASEKDPKNPEYLDTLGWVHLRRKEFDAALKIFKDLTIAYPSHGGFRYHLANALADQGQALQAKNELRTALGLRLSAEDEREARQLMARLR